ncbi:MAG: DUF3737 family protein [Firmicutes bacterium]|nr:DUF3737 family protein [Bacillota bacterium]
MSKEVREGFFEGERSLFQASGLKIYDTVFGFGESPLKEGRDIELYNTIFEWKYPLWYSKNVKVKDCTLFNDARAGVWYTENAEFSDCVIDAPKTFRRCRALALANVDLTSAAETLWNCENVTLQNVSVKGTYFGMGSADVTADNLRITGDYCFDGGKNITVKNSRIISKDAFWNCENVTVENSFVSGEYFGWNSKNVTLINCTVESEQGLCYMDNVVMKNCKLIHTNLAFEYSTADADIKSNIESVKNPVSGRITADSIGEIIFDNPCMNKNDTEITVRNQEGVRYDNER